MADEIDVANVLIEGELERALSNIRQAAARSGKGSKTCAECGDDIPEARRKLGYHLCISCAEHGERKKSLFVD